MAPPSIDCRLFWGGECSKQVGTQCRNAVGVGCGKGRTWSLRRPRLRVRTASPITPSRSSDLPGNDIWKEHFGDAQMQPLRRDDRLRRLAGRFVTHTARIRSDCLGSAGSLATVRPPAGFAALCRWLKRRRFKPRQGPYTKPPCSRSSRSNSLRVLGPKVRKCGLGSPL